MHEVGGKKYASTHTHKPRDEEAIETCAVGCEIGIGIVVDPAHMRMHTCTHTHIHLSHSQTVLLSSPLLLHCGKEGYGLAKIGQLPNVFIFFASCAKQAACCVKQIFTIRKNTNCCHKC